MFFETRHLQSLSCILHLTAPLTTSDCCLQSANAKPPQGVVRQHQPQNSIHQAIFTSRRRLTWKSNFTMQTSDTRHGCRWDHAFVVALYLEHLLIRAKTKYPHARLRYTSRAREVVGRDHEKLRVNSMKCLLFSSCFTGPGGQCCGPEMHAHRIFTSMPTNSIWTRIVRISNWSVRKTGKFEQLVAWTNSCIRFVLKSESI